MFLDRASKTVPLTFLSDQQNIGQKLAAKVSRTEVPGCVRIHPAQQMNFDDDD